MSAPQSTAARSLRRHIAAGAALLAILLGGFGGWAATTEISGAVMAPGRVVVDTHVKKVQHATGGIVAAIAVRDGDTVQAGDLLVQLDPTVAGANLKIVTGTLDQLLARKARLDAERDGSGRIAFPPGLTGRSAEPDVAAAIAGEGSLFAARREARATQRSQLGERVRQLQQEIVGLEAQRRSKDDELRLVDKELEGVRALWERKLIEVTRLTALEREAARLAGEAGKLTSDIAQTRGRIAEIALQVGQIDQDLLMEVGKELRETESRIAELGERLVAAKDQLKRLDLHAPQAGVVHELAVHTLGGVVSPGDTLMVIVPEADRLIVEAKVPPMAIDQIRVGQAAGLRFTSFNQRTTPEIEGRITTVSADTSTNERTAEAYYDIRIEIADRELARLRADRIVPGMPVEVFLRTGERSVLSYLSKPLADQLARTFRER
jgi:HlyD family secretion protein